MSDVDQIRAFYRNQARQYQQLVARQDWQGNLMPALNAIVALEGALVVEFGAGTGNLTSALVDHAAGVHAFDIEAAMLARARSQLLASGQRNWRLALADNDAMPVASNCADLAIEAWCFVHVLDWQPKDWRKLLDRYLAQMQRILKPGGTAILIEDLGIGKSQPGQPTPEMERLHGYLEAQHGFQGSWIRTDYRFESPERAEELSRFFFGDDLAELCLRSTSLILPECTGIWWKRF